MKKMKLTPLEQELMKKHFRVAIFGSARIQKNDPTYKKIYSLAKMLGAREIDVVTGGGPGLMDAANAGHMAGRKSKSTHSLGLNIKLPYEQHSNSHLDIQAEFSRFTERLDTFMTASNVLIVGPGGIGTLLELVYAWQVIQVHQINNIPIVLFGDMWTGLIQWIEDEPLKHHYLNPDELGMIYIADTPKGVMKLVDAFHTAYKKNPEAHLNVKKYPLKKKTWVSIK